MRLDNQIVDRIKEVKSFPSMLKFLRDDLNWPIESDDVEDLTFEYSPDELGFDKKMAVKVRSIKQLRPLVKNQPWGIFYVDFEPKRLPVGALRRLLRSLVIKKRGGGDGSQATWNLNDLLFISFHGEESRRTVAFAHFHERDQKQPQLRTFYWDQGETEFASVLESLGKLNWPQYAGSAEMAHVWRQYWGAAFRVGHGEVIRDSKALSKKLAQVALKIRQHVFDLLDAEDADKGPLHRLFASFKKALLHDLDEQRFADVLAQTFTYGLLAAKAEIGTKTPLEPGHLAEQIPATNPLLRELFEEFQHLTGVGLDKLDEDLGDLGVDELVDLLNTVDVDEALKNFGRTTMSGQEDPVVHFYEEFLKDYDKEQKVERGVFYTPKPVVSFIVRSVHEILQKEFKLEDGLADTSTWDQVVDKHPGLVKPEGIRGDEPFVQILDPAVGTGTFLEACIQLIYDTLATKWARAGKNVEEQWNRYVPEHLLPRLHGFELMMAPYVVCHMKLGLRLKELGYDFQSGERLRVFLTNTLEPPVKRQEMLIGLMDAVANEAHRANVVKKEVLFSVVVGNPPYSIQSGNLSDEVRQLIERYRFCMGERIRERNALQFEKNLQDDYIKFIRYAELLLQRTTFGLLGYVTNHTYFESRSFRGMRESLLSSFGWLRLVDLGGSQRKQSEGPDENVFDIQQGVAIAVGVATRERQAPELASWNGTREEKYARLISCSARNVSYTVLNTKPPFFQFAEREESLADEYENWHSTRDLFGVFASGVKTHKDKFAYAFTREEMAARLSRFRDLAYPSEQLRTEFSLLDTPIWKLEDARRKTRDKGDLEIVRALYRPFDFRSLVFDESIVRFTSRGVMKHLTGRNVALLLSQQQISEGFAHAFVCNVPADWGSVSNRSRESTSVFPLWLTTPFSSDVSYDSNLVAELFDEPLCERTPAELFNFLYALLHSATYRDRYSSLLKTDFPRLPTGGALSLFESLTVAGRDLIELHLMADEVVSVAPSRLASSADFVLDRTTYLDEILWLDERRTAQMQVSQPVWEFVVGGYQPAQKWLKDRKGRTLSDVDIRHYEQMLFAIEETIRIMAKIDEVIEEHGGWPAAFQGDANG